MAIYSTSSNKAMDSPAQESGGKTSRGCVAGKN